jgi:hypothetical protein
MVREGGEEEASEGEGRSARARVRSAGPAPMIAMRRGGFEVVDIVRVRCVCVLCLSVSSALFVSDVHGWTEEV